MLKELFKEPESIKTDEIYVLRPSKIKNVEGTFSTTKIPDTDKSLELVDQVVTFETLPNQVVTVCLKTLIKQSLYKKIHLNNELLIGFNELHKGYYYDKSFIEGKGLTEDDRNKLFVGLLPLDILTLKDYYFIKSLGDVDLLKKLKYFYGLFSESPKLKEEYHNSFNLPDEISVKELRRLQRELNHVDLGTQELTQTYSNMKKELTYSYHNGYIIPSRFGYLGTEEDIKVKKSNLDKQFIHMHEEWERIDHSSQEDKPKKKTLKNLFK